MKNYFYLALGCLALSCANQNVVKRDLSDVRFAPNTHAFVLPDLPLWANGDEHAKCQREKNFHYLDLPMVMKNFSLNYKQALDLQVFYNLSLEESTEETLDLAEQSFFNSLVKIQGDVSSVFVPEFKTIYLYWVDSAMNSEDSLKRMKSFFKSSAANEGFPIFVSLCKSQKSLEKWIEDLGMNELGARAIGAQFTSPYSANGDKHFEMDIDLRELFPKDKELILLTAKDAVNLPESWKKIVRRVW